MEKYVGPTFIFANRGSDSALIYVLRALCPFICVFAIFKLLFVAYWKTAYILCCTFFLKDWNFIVFKMDKTASENSSEEQHGQLENEEFEASERVILLL